MYGSGESNAGQGVRKKSEQRMNVLEKVHLYITRELVIMSV